MLKEKGFEIVETELSRPLRLEYASPPRDCLSLITFPLRPRSPPSGYHTPEMLMDAFRLLETSNPEIARLIDLTSYYDQAPGHEGGHIWAIKISVRTFFLALVARGPLNSARSLRQKNVDKDEDEENYLIVSNHHSRELVTPEIALNISQKLVYECASLFPLSGPPYCPYWLMMTVFVTIWHIFASFPLSPSLP